MNAIYGEHPRHRAVHAKGMWCEGTFTATPEARRALARSPSAAANHGLWFASRTRAAIPESHDAQRDARGMAVKLRPDDGDEIDIVATTSPTFATRTPEDFLELLRLRRPDPATGQPDMEALGRLPRRAPGDACPRSNRCSASGRRRASPPAPTTRRTPFACSTPTARGTWVRYRWLPGPGEATIDDDEARERGRDYLADELGSACETGPRSSTSCFQLAADGDSLEDPTAAWPDDRELVTAGTLEITEIVDDPEGGGHIEVFDPTRVVDGVEFSDDPILHARPKAYSVSAYKRLG